MGYSGLEFENYYLVDIWYEIDGTCCQTAWEIIALFEEQLGEYLISSYKEGEFQTLCETIA